MKCFPSHELSRYFHLDELQREGIVIRSEFEYFAQFPDSVAAQEHWTRVFLDILGSSQHYIVYLKDWNVFSLDEGVVRIIEGFRKALGSEDRPLIEAAGHLFSRDELKMILGLLRIIMAFEWGAYLIALDGQRPVIDVFDRFVRVICQNNDALATVKDKLARAGARELPPDFFAVKPKAV